MAKPKNNTGGNTQAIDSPKPKKAKKIAQVTLFVLDDGTVDGDFWAWEENEVGRRKMWTLSGDEFFKFLYRVQPHQVRVLASCCNVQIVTAGLPEDQQGPWISMKGGKARVLNGAEIKGLMDSSKDSPAAGLGDKLADAATARAEKAAGLTPAVGGPQPVG